MLLKDKFFEIILSKYQEVIQRQTEEGWFSYSDKKYCMFDQHTGYYLAFLYTYKNPKNPYFHNQDTLERAIKVWDYFLKQVNEEGLQVSIMNNEDVGINLDEWAIFHWMRTFDLLEDYLPGDTKISWKNMILRIANKAKTMIVTPEEISHGQKENYMRDFKYHTSNHYVWAVLALYYYGRKFDDIESIKIAEHMMDEIIDHQLPNGSWLENGTLVVKYADATLSAISLYEYFSGNERAAKALRKGLDFTMNTIYRDLIRIECLDGRNRNPGGKSVSLYAVITGYKYPDGISYLSKWITYMDESGELMYKLTALVNATVITSLLPDNIVIDEDNIGINVKDDILYPEVKARIVRKDSWIIPMCCLEQKIFDNRYNLYRQNLLSVFNKNVGLIIGGGHSITQPQFSCFNVITEDKLYYMHKDGNMYEDSIGMDMTYGGKPCKIEVKILSESKVSIEYIVEDLTEVDRAYVNIPLPAAVGMTIRTSDDESVLIKEYIAKGIESYKSFYYNKAEFVLSEDAVFNYPVFPYNSYYLKQSKDFGEVFGIITVELDYLNPKCTLEIKVNQ